METTISREMTRVADEAFQNEVRAIQDRLARAASEIARHQFRTAYGEDRLAIARASEIADEIRASLGSIDLGKLMLLAANADTAHRQA